MKLIYSTLMLVVFGFLLTSCKDYLNVNTDPNAGATANPDLLFVSETLGMSNNRSTEIWIPLGIMAQVFASGGNGADYGWGSNEDQYILDINTLNHTWQELYTNAIKNGSLAIAAALAAKPANTNAAAQHKIIQAYAYWELTAMFGDIPFSEANKIEISQPKFDAQKDVLQGILNLLDEAIGLIDVKSPLKISTPDLYFSGDMTKWKKFANALKLRILMMMVDSEPDKTNEIKTLIVANLGLSSNDDNVLFPYYNKAGNYNPRYNLFHQYTADVNIWLFDIDHTNKLLTDRNDPRLSIYFNPGPDAGGAFIPVAPAENADGTNAVVGKFFLQPDSKDPLLTYSEDLLLQAEAHARGFTGTMKDANTKLRDAITANMQFYNIAKPAIQTFLAGLPDLSTLSADDALKLIAEQQWLDLFNRPVEAWTQWRRTEIPALKPPHGTSVANMIRRWPYPPNEAEENTNTPAKAPLDEKMWFDK